ncbi:PKD domain-containing protein [Olleya aquimaris]|nr:PKD domain-containing protein [Olleya aquimaris]
MKRYSSISKGLLVILLIYNCSLFAQSESANWYFGNFAGVSFNSGQPVALTDGALITKEGCATISNANGELLFYTDGKTVWNRNHDIMPNGTDLKGDSSSTESAIIIPKPGSNDSYYIFTTDKPNYFLSPNDPIEGLNYSEVNMQLDNGLGDLIVENKNIHLVTYNSNDAVQNEYKNSEKLTAVTHSNGIDIWVITQFINKFHAFKVTSSGVIETPETSTVPQNIFPRFNNDGANITAIGYLKVSPDGKQIAIAHSSTTSGSVDEGTKSSGKVLLYDFDNTTGLVNNEKTILEDTYPYGVEFSPDSKLLYVTTSNFDSEDTFINSSLFQFNTEANNIMGSKTNINTSSNVAGALQLAIDGKIYRAGYVLLGSKAYLSVINNPNQLSSSCNYTHNTFYLEGRDTEIGLPPFIQSIFKYSFNYENICLNDNTYFYITSEDPYDSVLWDFGDGTTSTDVEAYHTYANAGNYTVTLNMSINGVDYQPLYKQVKIVSPPEVIQTTYDLIECDSWDDNPSDGITVFNLSNANDYLVIDPTQNFSVYYYHTLELAQNDIDNTNSINPDYYLNQYNDEIIVAKITSPNTSCFNIAYVKLKTTQAINLGEYQLNACDLNYTGHADFNLETIRQQIINSLTLTGQVSVNFYLSEAEAAIGSNSLTTLYNSDNRTIYIAIENDNVCFGYGQLDLMVNQFPYIENQYYQICQNEFPITINSGLNSIQIQNYNYSWENGMNTESIQVSNPGTYNLTVTDPNLDCGKTIQIEVLQTPSPQIQSVTVDNYSATIVLSNSHENFEFALDNNNYQSSNIFTNLSPGNHTVYVRDINLCEITSQTIKVIGFPKYFTPNNDNHHEFWNIIGINEDEYPNLNLYIYDRYGKKIANFNPTESNGWDGTYNNKTMPQNDYWYKLQLPDGTIYSGHFTLRL